jgi:hypothetical protein
VLHQPGKKLLTRKHENCVVMSNKSKMTLKAISHTQHHHSLRITKVYTKMMIADISLFSLPYMKDYGGTSRSQQLAVTYPK